MRGICKKQTVFALFSLFALCMHVKIFSCGFNWEGKPITSASQQATSRNKTITARPVTFVEPTQRTTAPRARTVKITACQSKSTLPNKNKQQKKKNTKSIPKSQFLKTKILSLEKGKSPENISRVKRQTILLETKPVDPRISKLIATLDDKKESKNIEELRQKLILLKKENHSAFNEFVLTCYYCGYDLFNNLSYPTTSATLPLILHNFKFPERTPKVRFWVITYVKIINLTKLFYSQEEIQTRITHIQTLSDQSDNNKENYSSNGTTKKKKRTTRHKKKKKSRSRPSSIVPLSSTYLHHATNNGSCTTARSQRTNNGNKEYQLPTITIEKKYCDIAIPSYVPHSLLLPPTIKLEVAAHEGVAVLRQNLYKIKTFDPNTYVDVVLVSHYNARHVYDQKKSDYKPLELLESSCNKLETISSPLLPISLKNFPRYYLSLINKENTHVIPPSVCYLIAQLTKIPVKKEVIQNEKAFMIFIQILRSRGKKQ